MCTYLVSRNAIPIDQQELETDVVQTISTVRYVENEGFVEHRAEGAFLSLRLPLNDALIVV